MSWILAAFVVVAFAVAVERLGLPDRARESYSRARNCLEVMRDPSLSDAHKEDRLQRQSLQLFRLLGVLAGGSFLALALPLLVVWLLGFLGPVSFPAVLAVLERVDFLVGATVLGSCTYLLLRRIGRA